MEAYWNNQSTDFLEDRMEYLLRWKKAAISQPVEDAEEIVKDINNEFALIQKVIIARMNEYSSLKELAPGLFEK